MTSFLSTTRSVWWVLLVLLPGWALPPCATAQTTPPCDYTTASVTLNSVGGSGGGTVRYVLTDASGLIRQVSSTPTFSGFAGIQTYSAVAISYDGTATNLTVGSALSAVTASCFDLSDALTLRVCVAGTDSDGDGITDENDLCPGTPAGTSVNAYGCPKTATVCSYTTGSFTLALAGGSGNGTVRYVLADSVGVIRQLSSTPEFSGLTGSHTFMVLAIAHDGTVTNLAVGQALRAVSATCYDWSDALVLKVCVTPDDEDKDGVIDEKDLCPGTLVGTPVNAYGCPTSLSVCSYTGNSFSLISTNGSGDGTVRYVLADSVGTILQVSPLPVFAGLSGSRTYMALAISHDGTATNLMAGQPLSAVSATCYDWSDALVVRVCVPVPTACDYTVGEAITLQTAGGSAPAGTPTRYLLVDANGLIVQIVTTPTPTFSTTGLAPGLYTAYALVNTDDGSLVNLQTGHLLTAVQANCLAMSAPMPLRLCPSCVVARCIPVTITRAR